MGEGEPPVDAKRAIDEAILVERAEDLAHLCARLERADRVALDVEANGMFVYRARLCTVQLAFEESGVVHVAIVDSLRVDPSPLARALGSEGPLKVLHDLAFDARLLADHGLSLGRVCDTSVLARFVGLEATGLSSVLGHLWGISLHKGLQKHDWAERPLQPAQLRYLASDVVYLLALCDALEARAHALDVSVEAADESAYRLEKASRPPLPDPVAWARVKGSAQLAPVERAVLRRLHAEREAIAETLDRPAHRVLPADRLLELARARPSSQAELARVLGTKLRAGPRWLAAIAQGLADGDVPEVERALLRGSPPSAESVRRRRRAEGLVSGWRAREAATRGVDPQAVLPGHCASDLTELLLRAPLRSERSAALGAIAGIGERRSARYRQAWLELFDALDDEPATTTPAAATTPATEPD